MKKIACIGLVMALVISLVGCGQAQVSSSESANEPSSSTQLVTSSAAPSQSTPNLYPEYSGLARLINGVVDSKLLCDVELPDMDTTRNYVDMTDDVRNEVFNLLTQDGVRVEQGMLDDDSRDRTSNAASIELLGCVDGFYPNGEQISYCAIIPLGSNDAIAPNSTFVSVFNNATSEFEAYIYPADMYSKLIAILSAKVTPIYADLEGEYLRMSLVGSEGYALPSDILERGNILLQSRYSSDGERYSEKWIINAFDLTTGKSLYQVKAPENGERGALLSIQELKDIPDYDYCLYFEKGMAYRFSGDSTRDQYFPLPVYINTVQRNNMGRPDFYDEDDDAIVWADSDGIHLRITKQGGIVNRFILPNSHIKKLFTVTELPTGPDYSGNLYYTAPRFICDGQKVVAAIYPDFSQSDNIGVVVYDIAKGKISSQLLGYHDPTFVKYPITDRYVAAPYQFGRLLDAEIGEIKQIPGWSLNCSYDFKTCILIDNVSNDARNASAYVCDVDKPNDKSKPLLRPKEPNARIHLLDTTEHYAVFSVQDYDGNWLAVAKYK